MDNEKKVFETLNDINVNNHTEEKNGLTYLSWPWAWSAVKRAFPDATYQVRHWDGKPYFEDDDLGIMVETSVTINGETLSMWLPVMDSKNKAQKSKPYSYTVSFRGQRQERQVEAATMFDVNTAIMRCLVKNLAMFGLGLYIYSGEDLPETEQNRKNEQVYEAIKSAKTRQELANIYNQNPKLQRDPDFVTALKLQNTEITTNA